MKLSEIVAAVSADQEKFDPKEALRLVTDALKGIASVTSRPDLAKKYGVQTATQAQVKSKPAKWPSRMPVQLYPVLHFFIDKVKGQIVLQAVKTDPSVSGPSKPKKVLGYTPLKSINEVGQKVKQIFQKHGHEALTY
jgi:ribosomal protein S10